MICVCYLIGVDGVNSFVCCMFGIEWFDFGYNECWFNFDLENKCDFGDGCVCMMIYCDLVCVYMYMLIGMKCMCFELCVLLNELMVDWEIEVVGWKWFDDYYGYGLDDLILLCYVVYMFEMCMVECWCVGCVLFVGDVVYMMMLYMG